MAKTEVALLPPRTYITNQSPGIVAWRARYGRVISHNETQQAPHKIYGPGTFNLDSGSNEEHRFRTRGEQEWRLQVSPDVNLLTTRAPRLSNSDINDIAELLTTSQHIYVPKGAETDHADAIHFMSRNWGRVRDLLSPIKPMGDVPPYTFSEVIVDSRTQERADFIGMGRDGRLFVFEFKRKWFKYSQAGPFAEKLKQTLYGFDTSVTPYMAWYTPGERFNTVHVQIPNKEGYFRAGRQVENFFQRSPRPKIPRPTSSLREFEKFAIEHAANVAKAV